MIEQPLLFGPCAKRRTQAVLTLVDGRTFVGENVCLNPQPVCPRAPGEGYDKCQSVCRQVGHAEQLAIRSARGVDAELAGASIKVTHTHGCTGCTALMDHWGIDQREFVGAPDA